MLNQDPTHGLGGRTVEVRTTVPSDIAIPNKPQVGFVNQGCGLKRVGLSFTSHLPLRKITKRSVDQRQEISCRIGTAGGCIR
jgi:hypothetical protein